VQTTYSQSALPEFFMIFTENLFQQKRISTWLSLKNLYLRTELKNKHCNENDAVLVKSLSKQSTKLLCQISVSQNTQSSNDSSKICCIFMFSTSKLIDKCWQIMNLQIKIIPFQNLYHLWLQVTQSKKSLRDFKRHRFYGQIKTRADLCWHQ